jgi:phosphatidylglycerol:prolipoprotein diacylglycerol transferase
MYVCGFLLGGYLMKVLARRGWSKLPEILVDPFITWNLVGMFFGARLVYVFIYNWDYYSNHLTEILSVWQGGLSYHGAILGFLVAQHFFSKKYKIAYMHLIDLSVTAGAIGVFFGRMGNFINGELYGHVTTMPWGFIFPGAGPFPRHPSQLYEGILESVVLWCILWWTKDRVKYRGMQSGIYFIGYGVFRFIVEFFREPDTQLGYYFGGMITMGQILCFLMMIGGAGMILYAIKKKNSI